MLNMIHKRIRNKKGFTLVELIVVMAIISILAGIAIPRISGYQEAARVTADRATKANIMNGIALGLATGTIPTDTTAISWLDTDANISAATVTPNANEAAVRTSLANIFGTTPPRAIQANSTGYSITIASGEVSAVTVTGAGVTQ